MSATTATGTSLTTINYKQQEHQNRFEPSSTCSRSSSSSSTSSLASYQRDSSCPSCGGQPGIDCKCFGQQQVSYSGENDLDYQHQHQHQQEDFQFDHHHHHQQLQHQDLNQSSGNMISASNSSNDNEMSSQIYTNLHNQIPYDCNSLVPPSSQQQNSSQSSWNNQMSELQIYNLDNDQQHHKLIDDYNNNQNNKQQTFSTNNNNSNNNVDLNNDLLECQPNHMSSAGLYNHMHQHLDPNQQPQQQQDLAYATNEGYYFHDSNNLNSYQANDHTIYRTGQPVHYQNHQYQQQQHHNSSFDFNAQSSDQQHYRYATGEDNNDCQQQQQHQHQQPVVSSTTNQQQMIMTMESDSSTFRNFTSNEGSNPVQNNHNCSSQYQTMTLASATTTTTTTTNMTNHKLRQSGNSRKRGRPRKKGIRSADKVNGKLWEFIRDLLLNDRTNPSFIRWERREDGVFKFVQSDKVAKMWGERKQNPKMTYEKLSRAMRYYYKSKVLLPVFGRRLVYKFGPNATGWLPPT